MKQWQDAGNLFIVEKRFKIDQHVLVLVKGFVNLFEIRK